LTTENRIDFPLNVGWSSFDHQYAASDSNGHIWVLSHAGDLEEFWRDGASGWHSYRHRFSHGNPSLGDFDFNSHSRIAATFSFDAAGHLWLARADKQFAITCYEIQSESDPSRNADMGRSRLKELLTIPFPKRIHSFVVEGNKRLWVNLYSSQGMEVIDLLNNNKVIRRFSDKDGFPTNYVRDLFQDSHGNIWGSTLGSGVIRLAERDVENGRFKEFSIKDGMPGVSTVQPIEDRPGNILVGVNNKGLALINGDSVKTLSMTEGLPSNYISCMTVDLLGRIWLGTGIGMVCETAQGSWRFKNDQSLLEAPTSACGTTKDGLLWWVTPNKLSVYDYLSEPKSSLPPPVQIRGMKVNGAPTELTEAAAFTYHQNDVEIEFIGISLKDPEAIRYQYRLLGTEGEWNTSTRSTSILYGNLSPGSYTFEVKAINGEGVESISPAMVMFTIMPPYWRRWWFYSSASTIVALLIYAGYRSRVQRLLREQKLSRDFSLQLISSQEDERKRVARELHDDLGQELIVISNRARRGLKSASEGQTKSQLDLIVSTASRALESVRAIAYNLSPYHLDQVGLTAAIKGMVERMTESTNVRFALTLDHVDSRFSKEVEIHLFRIAQECVNNIAKHSQASEAWIRMTVPGGTIEIEIGDNGKGFDPSPARGALITHRGFGLSGLRERVRLLAGTILIVSSPGKGTRLLFSIPCGKDPSPGSAGVDDREKTR
jgi:signal transduction histidine kinase